MINIKQYELKYTDTTITIDRKEIEKLLSHSKDFYILIHSLEA